MDSGQLRLVTALPVSVLPPVRRERERERRSRNRGSNYDEYVSDPMNPVPYTQKITLNYPRDFMTEDQRFAGERPDVLVYQTLPLTEDITVAGSIKPELFISSSGTDSISSSS